MSIPKGSQINHKQLVILRCKLVVLGDAAVGKTALTQVFQSSGAIYPKNYMMTIGAEYSVKQVPVPDSNSVVELHIYDCAGASIFNQVEMNAKYYENAAAVALVFDVSNRESLLACRKWLTALKTSTNSNNVNLFGVLIGNKCDYRMSAEDEDRVEVLTDDAARMAQELGLKYFETSAANNINVEEPFKYLATEFNRRYADTITHTDDMIENEY